MPRPADDGVRIRRGDRGPEIAHRLERLRGVRGRTEHDVDLSDRLVLLPGRAAETPSTALAASTTASTWAGSVSTAAGATVPAGKAAETVSSPSTDSALVRNVSA